MEKGEEAGVREEREPVHLYNAKTPSEVEEFLKAGAQLEEENQEGQTALFVACVSDNLSVLETLLLHGADPTTTDRFGCPAIQMASEKGNINIVRRLLEEKTVDVNLADESSALIQASEEGHTDVVDYLLGHGADPNVTSCIGTTALMVACTAEKIDVVDRLLKAGADVHAEEVYGWTAIMSAACAGNLGLIDRLVIYGADCNFKNHDKETPLILAAGQNRVEAVQRFLGLGCDANGEDGCWSPLLSAAKNGHAETVKVLLEHGVDTSITSYAGLKAFDVATTDEIKQLILGFFFFF